MLHRLPTLMYVLKLKFISSVNIPFGNGLKYGHFMLEIRCELKCAYDDFETMRNKYSLLQK